MSREAIERALREAGIDRPLASCRDLSGGCIHRVSALELADGTLLVAKTNTAKRFRWFEEEAAGLQALARTETVLLPEPLVVARCGGTAVLLMTAIRTGQATEASWRRFGEELAALHRRDAGERYGFETDNHLGATEQPNPWCDDWVRFNAEHRLGHQLELARAHDRLASREATCIERVIARLERLIPRRPKPALLHGDLWSGNALAAVDGAAARIALIDPACSIGDGYADLAMMKLFGGFPPAVFDAYAAASEDRDRIDSRVGVYQLYHVLNHVNLFGRGYVAQAMGLADRLIRS